MLAKQIFYQGHVQGVGFRYSVKQIAKGFAVTGWIRNLPDGRVELQASGEATELNAFLETIAQSELAAHIKETQETQLAAAPVARGFEIRQA